MISLNGFGYASLPWHPLHHLWCIEYQNVLDEIDVWIRLI